MWSTLRFTPFLINVFSVMRGQITFIINECGAWPIVIDFVEAVDIFIVSLSCVK